MNKRIFIVAGLRPVDRGVDLFLAACDLGIDGSFEPFKDRVTVTLAPDVTESQLNRQPDGIRRAYEAQGCVQVTVIEEGYNG